MMRSFQNALRSLFETIFSFNCSEWYNVSDQTAFNKNRKAPRGEYAMKFTHYYEYSAFKEVL